jgi:hypothetical protein
MKEGNNMIQDLVDSMPLENKVKWSISLFLDEALEKFRAETSPLSEGENQAANEMIRYTTMHIMEIAKECIDGNIPLNAYDSDTLWEGVETIEKVRKN